MRRDFLSKKVLHLPQIRDQRGSLELQNKYLYFPAFFSVRKYLLRSIMITGNTIPTILTLNHRHHELRK